MEVMVAMTIFAMFLAAVFLLTAEMRSWEKRLPINMHKNAQIAGVMGRLRRDVLDGFGSDPFRAKHAGFKSGEKVLIIESVQSGGGVQMIVWDFRERGVVRRLSWNVGVKKEWVTRGLPEDFSSVKIGAEDVPNAKAWGVRISATDANGRLAIDQILLPRATHELESPKNNAS